MNAKTRLTRKPGHVTYMKARGRRMAGPLKPEWTAMIVDKSKQEIRDANRMASYNKQYYRDSVLAVDVEATAALVNDTNAQDMVNALHEAIGQIPVVMLKAYRHEQRYNETRRQHIEYMKQWRKDKDICDSPQVSEVSRVESIPEVNSLIKRSRNYQVYEIAGTENLRVVEKEWQKDSNRKDINKVISERIMLPDEVLNVLNVEVIPVAQTIIRVSQVA